MARPITITTENWVARARVIHGEKYGYERAIYQGSVKPITITCQKHGDFYLRSSKHLEGVGCKECNVEHQRNRPEDFLLKARKAHGDYYDYSLVSYTGLHHPITIVCPVHGKFTQKPVKHIAGQGCKRCKGFEVWNSEEFLEKAEKIHGDKYSYVDSDYLKTNIKIKIYCKSCHNQFEQTPNSHLSGSGCPFCGGSKKWSDDEFRSLLADAHDGEIVAVDPYVNMDAKLLVRHICGREWKTTPAKLIHRRQGCPECALDSKRMTDAEFRERLSELHNSEIVALGKYIQSKQRIKVKHLVCGREWWTESRIVLRNGCRKCAYDALKTTPDEFERRLVEIHKGEIVTLEPYRTVRERILVRHICGHEWRVIPGDLIRRATGCPICASSKGNKLIAEVLAANGIEFEVEVRFESCKHKIALPFDFYIPKHEMLIEYDGEQHFKSIDFWGGEVGLRERQTRDLIKDKWAHDNSKRLYRIRYDEDVIRRLEVILSSTNA